MGRRVRGKAGRGAAVVCVCEDMVKEGDANAKCSCARRVRSSLARGGNITVALAGRCKFVAPLLY